MINDIKTLDFNSDNLGKELVKSLHTIGFALIRNHSLDNKLINSVYNEWGDFFSSDIKEGYFLEFWKWNKSLRLDRFFKTIK